MKSFEYLTPRSIEEATDILNKYGNEAKIIAGGTDLIVQMKAGSVCPSYIVDIKYIDALNRLDLDENGSMHIGAAVILSRIVDSGIVKNKFPMLHQACSLIGSDQIRNRATLCGNICNAAPSADSAPPLLCLGARALVADQKGMRTIALEKFFRGPGHTVLKPGQILVGIEVPKMADRSSSHYIRLTTREEMDIAMVGVASFISLTTRDKVCNDIKIALGAVSPTPILVSQMEAAFKGKPITIESIEHAGEMAAGCCIPISDMRASAEYRREMVKVLTRRTLTSICADLGIQS